MDNISELNGHSPSVESVISRLDRYQERIKSITCIVEWDDESFDVVHNEKRLQELAFEIQVFQKYLTPKFKINSDDKEGER